MAGNNSFITNRGLFPIADIDGEIVVYQYHTGRRQQSSGTGVAYTRGSWNRMEVHCKMNSPRSSSNGEYHIYKNGQLVGSNTSRRWVTTSQAWHRCYFTIYAGGDSNVWIMPQNQSVYLDNIIISENPITH